MEVDIRFTDEDKVTRVAHLLREGVPAYSLSWDAIVSLLDTGEWRNYIMVENFFERFSRLNTTGVRIRDAYVADSDERPPVIIVLLEADEAAVHMCLRHGQIAPFDLKPAIIRKAHGVVDKAKMGRQTPPVLQAAKVAIKALQILES